MPLHLCFLSQVKLGIYASHTSLWFGSTTAAAGGYLLMPLFVTLQSGKQENRTLRFMKRYCLCYSVWTLGCVLMAAAGWYLFALSVWGQIQ